MIALGIDGRWKIRQQHLVAHLVPSQLLSRACGTIGRLPIRLGLRITVAVLFP